MKKNKGVTIDKCVIGQEYWLDSCMDESGIYAGNGKWIPEIRKHYAIDEDGLIKLSGGLFYPKNNSMKAESGNTMRIPIPTGHTAKIDNDAVIFEPKTAKFNKGDFVSFSDNNGVGGFAIIDNIDESICCNNCFYFAMVNLAGTLYFDDSISNIESWGEFRLASNSEKQILLDKLHEAGKDWDAEKCEIVDWVWRPKSGDSIWSINGRGEIFEWTFFGTGEYLPQTVDFRTPELAESALELLKQAKHY